MSKTHREKKLFNKVIIFVLFVQKKYYCSFIATADVTFISLELALNLVVALQGQKALGFNQTYLKFVSYKFGTT